MTTPTLYSFHQKIFTHAKSAKVATDIHLTKNNPFRLYPDSVGALRPLREQSAFTLIELLAVITIIGILAGLTLGAAGAVRRHGAASTAKAEVAALQAACDRYFAEKNEYPTTNSMPDPSSSSVPDVNPSTSSKYSSAGQAFFKELFGTNQYNRPPSTKRYFEPKPAMVSSTTNANPYLIDPWGYAYGYNCRSTTNTTTGEVSWNQPMIWSTAGTTKGETNKWITSWPKM